MAKIWMGNPPSSCNLCNKPIVDVFIDGATKYGPWGSMCEDCHTSVGIGLGAGKGQKYKKVRGRWERCVY